MNRPVLIAAGVVLLSNAWVLVHAARNRMGEPEAAVEMTERELVLNSARDGRSHRYVTLNWNHGAGAPIDEAKMAELGFDTGPAGRRAVYRQPPRPAWFAIEVDGPAWKKGLPAGEKWEVTPRTALIDAGRDPESLRARNPDRTRVLILRGMVRAQLSGDRLHGWPATILPATFSVPTGMADGIQPAWPVKAPRYAVRVAVGRNYEPYITAIRRLAP